MGCANSHGNRDKMRQDLKTSIECATQATVGAAIYVYGASGYSSNPAFATTYGLIMLLLSAFTIGLLVSRRAQ